MSAVEQLLSASERQEIVSRLANYHIPLHIMQLVADECGCSEIVAGRREMRGKSDVPLVARLNDRSLVQLRQIFLDCKDSFSGFRFATFLSSKFAPLSYKFVMSKAIRGRSGDEYAIDVCVYNRSTGDLVAIGMQNNDAGRKASDAKSVQRFLGIVGSVSAENPNLRSAYYSSSYGYRCDPSHVAAKSKLAAGAAIEIKFLEYRNEVYRQVKE